MHNDEQKRDTCYVTEQKAACSVGHTWDGATLSVNKGSSGTPMGAQGRSVTLRDAQGRPGTTKDAQSRPGVLRDDQGRPGRP